MRTFTSMLCVASVLLGTNAWASGSKSGGHSSSRQTRSSRSSGSAIRSSSASSSQGGSRGPVVVVKSGRYDVGEALFRGRTSLSAVAGADTAAQRARLTALHAQLPEYARKKYDLPAMAGKLSGEQMASLEYFLEYRYGIR